MKMVGFIVNFGMKNRFRDKLIEAMVNRKRANLPKLNLTINLACLLTLAYIVLAIFAVPSGKLPDYHFVSERGALTVLSAFLLAMASSFSIGSLVATIRTRDLHIWMWVIMTLAFGVLSLDELLQFHERFGAIIGRSVDSGIFRNWGDVIVILYGVIALLIMVPLLPSMMRYPMLVELFATAFIFYAIHTLIDSTQEPRTIASAILEEAAKLFCVLFLALGTFVAFLGSLWKLEPSDKLPNDV